jgi:hypothetical protein
LEEVLVNLLKTQDLVEPVMAVQEVAVPIMERTMPMVTGGIL